jgi:hypothetical protein
MCKRLAISLAILLGASVFLTPEQTKSFRGRLIACQKVVLTAGQTCPLCATLFAPCAEGHLTILRQLDPRLCLGAAKAKSQAALLSEIPGGRLPLAALERFSDLSEALLPSSAFRENRAITSPATW